HQVGTQVVQPQAQIVQGLARAQGRPSLVDVVADDADKRHEPNGAPSLWGPARRRADPGWRVEAAGRRPLMPADYFISLRRCAGGYAARAVVSRRPRTAPG